MGPGPYRLAGVLFMGESATVWRVLSLVLVLAGVVGLKVFHWKVRLLVRLAP